MSEKHVGLIRLDWNLISEHKQRQALEDAGVEAVVVYDHHGKRQPNPLFRRLRPGQTLVVASLPCLGGYLEAVATAKRIFAKGCAIEVLHPRRRYDPGRHPEAAVTALDFVEDARRAKSAKETAAGRKVKKALGITGGRKMVYSDEDLIKAHATMMREKRSLRDVARDLGMDPTHLGRRWKKLNLKSSSAKE